MNNRVHDPAVTAAKYDAWNRPVHMTIVEDLGGTPTPILEQEFNGLHWRTMARRDTDLIPNGIDDPKAQSTAHHRPGALSRGHATGFS